MQVKTPSENPPVCKDSLQVTHHAHLKPPTPLPGFDGFLLFHCRMEKDCVRFVTLCVYTIETTTESVMDMKETMVTDIVIQAMKMDDTIKRQEVIIERLKSDKTELLIIISRMKEILVQFAPESIQQLELFKL